MSTSIGACDSANQTSCGIYGLATASRSSLGAAPLLPAPVIDRAIGGKIPAAEAATATTMRAMQPSDCYLHWDDPALFAVEILWRAHDLVAFGWCQGADATDAEHQPVEPWSARACHWSLLGALAAALGPPQQDTPESPALITELRLALVAISDLIPDWSLQHWNDHPNRTQSGVLEMLAAAHEHCSAASAANRP